MHATLEAKDESYYINKCNSSNEISKVVGEYGFIKTYQVEDKEVALTFNQYANGEDDHDDELVSCEIKLWKQH